MRITENGRYGYQDIGELKLNFTLKDGRNIEKNIDLIPLFTDLQKKEQPRHEHAAGARAHHGVAQVREGAL